MSLGFGVARAVQKDAVEAAQPECLRVQRMLAGQDDGRSNTLCAERAGDWLQLDGFGPGADDQTNIGETQPSP